MIKQKRNKEKPPDRNEVKQKMSNDQEKRMEIIRVEWVVNLKSSLST